MQCLVAELNDLLAVILAAFGYMSVRGIGAEHESKPVVHVRCVHLPVSLQLFHGSMCFDALVAEITICEFTHRMVGPFVRLDIRITHRPTAANIEISVRF